MNVPIKNLFFVLLHLDSSKQLKENHLATPPVPIKFHLKWNKKFQFTHMCIDFIVGLIHFFYETLFIDFSVLYICNANSGQTIFVYLSFLCITLIIRACLIVKFFHSFFFHSFIALFI